MGPLGKSGRYQNTRMDWLLVATAIGLVTAVGAVDIPGKKKTFIIVYSIKYV